MPSLIWGQTLSDGFTFDWSGDEQTIQYRFCPPLAASLDDLDVDQIERQGRLDFKTDSALLWTDPKIILFRTVGTDGEFSEFVMTKTPERVQAILDGLRGWKSQLATQRATLVDHIVEVINTKWSTENIAKILNNTTS